MKKMNYFNLILILVCLSFVGTSCSKEEKSEDKNSQENQSAGFEISDERDRFALSENFSEAVLDDLYVGLNIMAEGEQNQDGSIDARRIIIGNNEFDFQSFGFSSRVAENNVGRAPGAEVQNQEAPRRAFNAPEGYNPEQLMNMTDEERFAFREGFRGQRAESGARADLGGNSSILFARFIGEIIKMDENSLVLKMDEGGSKIIYFSENMIVGTIKSLDD